MKWISFFLVFTVSLTTLATEMVGALSAGMGGTGRSAVESIESLYLNPAGLALVDKFYFGAAYQNGYLQEGISRSSYGINFSDGTDGVILPGSFGYRSHKISDGSDDFEESEFRGGFGYRITKRVSIGAAYTYLDAEDGAGKEIRQHNGDLGLLVGLKPNWGLSVTGENILKKDNDLPRALKRQSRVTLGTQAIFKNIVVARYEALRSLYTEKNQLLTHRFGLGIILKAKFLLNMGYSIDNLSEQNWASAGLVWKGPRMKLAYSIQNESRQQLGNRHLVDLWLDL